MSTTNIAAQIANSIANTADTETKLESLSYSAAAIVKLKRQFGSTTEIAAAETAVLNKINTLAASSTDLNDLSYASAAIQHLDSFYADYIQGFAVKLAKTDITKVAFELSGSDLVTSQDIIVNINNVPVRLNQSTPVALPTLIDASDYKIYALSDGTLSAQIYDDAAPTDSVQLGGFHVYHTTTTINHSSIWDLKWRPTCNPRGMTLSPDKRVWVDIYLMDVDYGINAYSRGNVTIADGSNAPKIPTIYGGNGTTTYGSLTWFEAWDLAIAAGKRLPFYGEFTGFAYGVVEQQSCDTEPVTTKHQAGYRSVCGVEQATGCMWQWGADIQGNTGGVSAAITDGRGSVYHSGCTAVLLGSLWYDGALAGSRASYWNNDPSNSNDGVGSRAVCDHLILE